jgi:hypothetical protein
MDQGRGESLISTLIYAHISTKRQREGIASIWKGGGA